jgi:hypothetical protein
MPSVKLRADNVQFCTDFRSTKAFSPLISGSYSAGSSGRKAPSSAGLDWLACRRKACRPRHPPRDAGEGIREQSGWCLCCGGPRPAPCRRSGRPPQAEGLPHRQVASTGQKRC